MALQAVCLIALIALGLSTARAAPLAVSVYNGTTSQSPVKQGAKQVTFCISGFTGTIGNASFSNLTQVLQILAPQDGDRLNDIQYTVTSGVCVIIDVR